jgi:hypothetical protein
MQRLLLGLSLVLLSAPFLLQTAPPENSESSSPAFHLVADEGGKLPDNAAMEKLAREDPIAFLEHCLRRYQREVKGYSLTMQKQERIGGHLQKKEIMEVQFREEPYSVLMRWTEGMRLVERSLYVEGENDNKVVVRPAGLAAVFVKVVTRDPDGAEAKQAGRYTIKEFGLRKGTDRTLTSWKEGKERGDLTIQYLGEKKVKEAGDRVCWALRRLVAKPAADGVTDLTIFVDKETWLQVGSILKGAEGELIADYFFRDIKLNPEFKKDQFTRKVIEQ